MAPYRVGRAGLPAAAQLRNLFSVSDLSPLRRALALRSWRAALVGLVGVLAVYGLEQLAPAGWPRGAVASVAWLALGLGAIVAALRAAQPPPGRGRPPWAFVTLAAGAWTI